MLSRSSEDLGFDPPWVSNTFARDSLSTGGRPVSYVQFSEGIWLVNDLHLHTCVHTYIRWHISVQKTV